ncbi:MAG: tetratricopeptide repeat protein [Xenococcus sp. (in: cyanobacteria)]
MENWKSSAREMIAAKDWNGLSDLAQKWINAETGSGIPKYILFATGPFTTPPKIEEIAGLQIRDEDGIEALSWLESLPDGICRNLLHACALSFENVDASIQALKMQAKNSPTPEVYIALGLSYKDSDMEADYYDKAIALDSQNAFALHGRGIIESKKGNYQGAKDFLKRAVKACSDYAYARYDLAKIYEHDGQEELRREQLNEIVRTMNDSYLCQIVQEELQGKGASNFGQYIKETNAEYSKDCRNLFKKSVDSPQKVRLMKQRKSREQNTKASSERNNSIYSALLLVGGVLFYVLGGDCWNICGNGLGCLISIRAWSCVLVTNPFLFVYTGLCIFIFFPLLGK